MMVRIRFLLVLSGALVLLGSDARVAQAGGPPVFWLGGGGAPCNFSSLAIAIGAVPDGAVIRIADNQSYNDINLVIDNKSLTLQGGWADCAGTPSSNRSTLTGAAVANQPVIRVQSAVAARTVQLQHLVISGGTRSGVEVDGLVNLHLTDTLVSDNEAWSGGGLSVVGVSPGQTLVRLEHSSIGSSETGDEPGNTAALLGGGLYCVNARVQLGGGQIRGNSAGHHGGGLFLNGCAVQLLSSTLASPEFGTLTALIANNQSGSFGGGLYAHGGSNLQWLSAAGSAIRVNGNHALRGGGLYLGETDTVLISTGVSLTDNTAEHFGGGAFVTDGAYLEFSRGENWSDVCFPVAPCSRIAGNQVVATTTTAGSALQVSNASLALNQTEVSGNRSEAAAQAVIYLFETATARIANSLLHGNDSGPGRLIQVDGAGSLLAINGSTIVGNDTGPQLINLNSGAGSATVFFLNSVVWQPGTTILTTSAGTTVTSTCMNAHETSSIDADVHDPAFADAPAGNYRLHVDSPNIDACTDSFAGTGIDILGKLRPIDMTSASGALPAAADRGVINPDSMDRGAYELGDRIFADDFELQELL